MNSFKVSLPFLKIFILILLCFAPAFSKGVFCIHSKADFPPVSLTPPFLPAFGEDCVGWLVGLLTQQMFWECLLFPGSGLGVGIQRPHLMSCSCPGPKGEGRKVDRIQWDWSWGLKGCFRSQKAGCHFHSGKTREDFPKRATKRRKEFQAGEIHAKE